jgi:hypothetical protein
MIALIEYWSKDYSENPTHPKHRTEKDKVIREYRKRIKKAKLQKTKDKYRELIKQLTNQS